MGKEIFPRQKYFPRIPETVVFPRTLGLVIPFFRPYLVFFAGCMFCRSMTRNFAPVTRDFHYQGPQSAVPPRNSSANIERILYFYSTACITVHFRIRSWARLVKSVKKKKNFVALATPVVGSWPTLDANGREACEESEGTRSPARWA